MSSSSSSPPSAKVAFGAFNVTRQTFYLCPHAAAIVNLKPIVPGHVLVLSRRRVLRFADLSPEEVSAVFSAAQQVGKVVEKAYGAEGLTIAVQDGTVAGQTVPHFHVHVFPRREGDFEPKDKIYSHIDAFSAPGSSVSSSSQSAQPTPPPPEMNDGPKGAVRVDAEEARKPRSAEEMEKEAAWLRGLMGEWNAGERA